MRYPGNSTRMAALLFTMVLVVIVVQLGLIRIAFYRLGLSPGSALILLLCSLGGSALNLPIFTLRSRVPPDQSLLPPQLRFLTHLRRWEKESRTTVALNVGGGLIPVLFSIYLMRLNALPYGETAIAVIGVAAVSFLFSRPIPGVGIGMPVLIAPVCAALFAIIIDPERSAPLAYIGGSVGVLIGADLLRLKDVRALGAPFAAIGGAGTFDGIFITGLIAVLLA